MSATAPSRPERAPMAFTCDDLGRGAFAAWVTFMVILLAEFAVLGLAFSGDLAMLPIALGGVVVIGGVVSVLVTLLLSPIAWLLGTLLRRVRTVSVHVMAFAVLGAGVGLGMALLWTAWTRAEPATTLTTGSVWALVAATTASVVAGWAWALRHARRYRMDTATRRCAPARTARASAFEDHAADR